MREIKFRAWYVPESGRGYYLNNFMDGFNLSVLNSKTYSIEQYTGLKDKNGVEIYEGDIVKGKDMEGDIFYHAVKYSFGGFQPFCHYIESCRVDEVNCAIMGNIHENPRFLK